MEDPSSALLDSLQSVFHLEAMRNGRYCYPAVQQLKEATERYNPKLKNSFIRLLSAIKEALPHFEKWRIDFDSIRTSMDAMAKRHDLPPIDWNKVVSHPKVSSKFQFSALNHSRKDDNLLLWLKAKTGKSHTELDHHELTQAMLDNSNRHGFSQKLNAHLKRQPDFLFNLTMLSEKNFIRIVQSRLILYLTDEQLAKAIIHHSTHMVNKNNDPFKQVELFINKLNDLLSNGRSISTLLRNGSAKPILDDSALFQIYQSEEYANRDDKNPKLHSSATPEFLKPGL
ncbi:hypothetical protein [Legionella worsleiensis]|uniref:Uncharacterized protein n=1 Tax=Legionella worsleiensis TaxID=45076 RepID=A0A0W1AHB2_9GAMM|nr:hypothetical protein [Legionella worsleiensis]KTD80762.1 hypothetical protein Lwor_1005 [Legionella worsleiensis]STY32659.1 Uncharacterised protein [Legionella worsleiensis]